MHFCGVIIASWFYLRSCSWHGAVFTVEEGACVGGPCVGARLTPWAVEAREGRVFTA